MKEEKDGKMNRGAYFAVLVVAFLILLLLLLFVMEARKESPDLPTLFESMEISVLCSIVASIIYTIMHRVFSSDDDKKIVQQLQQMEKSLQRQNELYDSGVISIHPKTHFDNEESYWNNIINGTNKRLDLIGHSISNWFKREYKPIFVAKLKQIIESGNSVNIVLSGSNVNLRKIKEVFYGNQSENVLSKIEKTVLYLCQVLVDIPKDKWQYLRVYVNDLKKITYLYIRTDEQCIISPYIYSMDSNNNSFLLELQPRTSYVKSLEDDFEEMISDLEQIDLSLEKCKVDEHELVELCCEKTENNYSGSNWNFEKTEKHIYGDKFRKYEAGYFEHYADKEYVKSVIELPVSYGCPSKCLFCASSNIEHFEVLTVGQLRFMFEDIYLSKELNTKKSVLLSLTGMGDLYFNEDHVFEFLLSLAEYKNLSITLSSSFWDAKLLERAVILKKYLDIRYIQLTYISDLEDVKAKMIPFRCKRSKLPTSSDFIDYVAKTEDTFFRINYIVIANVNDSEEDVNRFINNTRHIKQKIVVRISKLNETNATRRNSLSTVSVDKLNLIKEVLLREGFNCYVFYSYKNDNMNCGQLLTEFP